MESHTANSKGNEFEVRQLIENWARAVRERNVEKILANHSNDIVMYDVPEPFQSVGIDAYRKTWETFFEGTKPGVFDIQQLQVFVDDKLAFCFATMKCADKNSSGDYVELDFRLTTGLKMINDKWMIVHEHHSIPAE